MRKKDGADNTGTLFEDIPGRKPATDWRGGGRGGTHAWVFRMRQDASGAAELRKVASILGCSLSEAVRVSVAHYRAVLRKSRHR